MRLRLLCLCALVAMTAQAAVPEDSETALKLLSVYPWVERCHQVDRVELLDAGQLGESDHVHRFGPGDTVPALKGKSAAIVPFAAHSSRRVVQRAVELLCRIQDPPSRKVIAALAAQHPCEGWLQTAVVGAGAGVASHPSATDCEGVDEPPILPEHWEAPADVTALAARISRGETGALRTALIQFDAWDPPTARRGAMALELIDDRPGFVLLAIRLGSRTLENVPGLMARLLARLAKAHGHSGEVELIELVRTHLALLEVIWDHGTFDSLSLTELAKLAHAWRGKEHGVELISFGEQLEDAVDTDIADQAAGAEKLEALFKQQDRAGLRTAMEDPMLRRSHRALAGSYLLQLGAAEGLEIFEEPASLRSGSTPAMREELQTLQQTARGALRTRIEAALRRYPKPEPRDGP